MKHLMSKLWLGTCTHTLDSTVYTLKLVKGLLMLEFGLFIFTIYENEITTRQSSINHYSCFQVNSGTVPTKAQTMMLT
ncbi:hypothetical protein JHK87_011510 [Glycine soja]|nr:hypothetical protein JHK87_011510 [Glycine soja]